MSKQARWYATAALGAAFLLGGGDLMLAQQQQQQQRPQTQSQPEISRQRTEQMKQENAGQVTVTGCLTSAEKNGFILTADPSDLNSAMSTRMKGAVTTVTYQLTGGNRQELTSLLGRRIEVKGRSDKEPRTTARHQAEREGEAKTEGTSGGEKPKVETTEKLKLEVRKLQVESVRTLGASCPAK